MSNITNSTMNRGVEAKEIEIANARLDLEVSDSTQWTGAGADGVAGVERCAGDAPAPELLSPALTGSYLQVVVEKHKSRREQRPAAPASRLPAASSPAQAAAAPWPQAAGAPWPQAAVLLACPASLAYYVSGGGGAEYVEGVASGAPVPATQSAKTHKSWHVSREREAPVPPPEDTLGDHSDNGEEAGRMGDGDAEPACVEVHRFERVGAWLASGGAPPTRVGARAARAGRAARRAGAELGAAARLAAGAAPLAAVLALRCALHAARDVAAAALLALSDYALKPALALTFNALLHPPLVFLANLLRGVRAALRPAVGLMSECAAPAAVLLRAARLVELHYTYVPPGAAPACACRRTHHC